MVLAVRFEVGFVYCNDVPFHHNYDDLKEAVTEYSTQLAEAIEPTPGPNSEKVHIREVWLIASDVDKNTVHNIAAGPFPCAHRPTKEEK